MEMDCNFYTRRNFTEPSGLAKRREGIQFSRIPIFLLSTSAGRWDTSKKCRSGPTRFIPSSGEEKKAAKQTRRS